MITVTAAEEHDVIVRALRQVGARVEPASVQADWLVEGDLRGHTSHGLQRLPVLVDRARRGLVDPGADGEIRWLGSGLATLDGRRGFGPVVGCHAVDVACDRVRETGVAVVAIRNSNHLGILAPYVERIADRGLMGIVLTTSEALVHPWGGRTAMVGTNPIAIGVPAHPHPFILDMATGAVSRGKVLALARRGEPLAPGWALDAAGRPAVSARDALDGAISPFGGAKGFGLGLAIELLVAGLTRSAFGRAVTGTLDSETVCNKGDVVICIDSSVDTGEGADNLSDYLTALRATPIAEGHQGVHIPGDAARARRASAARDGIAVDDEVWFQAVALAAASEEI